MDEINKTIPNGSHRRHIWLIVASITQLLAIVALIRLSYATQADYSDVIYPLHADSLFVGRLSLILAILLVPISVLGIVFTVLNDFKRQRRMLSDVLGLILVILAGVTVLVAGAQFFDPENRRQGGYAEVPEHVTSVYYNGHVYSLVVRTSIYSSRDYRYVLFECDSLGIRCVLLNFEYFSRYEITGSFKLRINPDTDTITVVLANNMIYQYSPQTQQGRMTSTPP